MDIIVLNVDRAGTVLGVSRVRMYKLSLQMLRLLVIGCSHM